VPDPAREGDRVLLARRLAEAGLAPTVRLVAHENRRVLAHVRGGTLRLHRGFAYAPDRVLRAVVVFAQGRPGPARSAARRELVSFPVHDYVPAPPGRPRKPRPRAGDRAALERLRGLHALLNARHFGGSLRVPGFRVSHRMRRRLGEVVALDGGCVIAMSGRHLARDGWDEVERTLLHEMVHQWQVETGQRPDHGPAFRRKAREVGIEAAARRAVATGARQAPMRRTDAV
jgi:hypothetical protein